MERLETTHYRIGSLVIRIISDMPWPVSDMQMDDFLIAETEADYTYHFKKISDIPAFTGNARVVGQHLFGYEFLSAQGEYMRGFWWKDCFYDAALRMGEKEATIGYISYEIMMNRAQNGWSFLNYLALEYLFLRHSGLVLHSSHVRVGDKALIFSAPSGTGKSTQADLWAKYAGAEIINGDRSLLRKKDGVWHAYGCPMCGTSGIHKQGNEPIHAIVMLSQGTENAVRRLTPGEAFQRMYPEITVPKWNRELVLRAMELLDDVMANVPIYAFSCTKDESAVIALREAIGL